MFDELTSRLIGPILEAIEYLRPAICAVPFAPPPESTRPTLGRVWDYEGSCEYAVSDIVQHRTPVRINNCICFMVMLISLTDTKVSK